MIYFILEMCLKGCFFFCRFSFGKFCSILGDGAEPWSILVPALRVWSVRSSRFSVDFGKFWWSSADFGPHVGRENHVCSILVLLSSGSGRSDLLAVDFGDFGRFW